MHDIISVIKSNSHTDSSCIYLFPTPQSLIRKEGHSQLPPLRRMLKGTNGEGEGKERGKRGKEESRGKEEGEEGKERGRGKQGERGRGRGEREGKGSKGERGRGRGEREGK